MVRREREVEGGELRRKRRGDEKDVQGEEKTLSSYKALGSVIHQTHLETLLVLKSLSHGLSQGIWG